MRIDGPRAWDERLVLSWVILDEDTTYVTELRNGVLNHRAVAAPRPGTTTFRLTRLDLIKLVLGMQELPAAIASGAVTVEGDPRELERLVGVLAPLDPDFAIVTP